MIVIEYQPNLVDQRRHPHYTATT